MRTHEQHTNMGGGGEMWRLTTMHMYIIYMICVCVLSTPQTISLFAKLFDQLLPDSSSSLPSSLTTSVTSPLFHALADLPAVKELCAIIYMPSDSIIAAASASSSSAIHTSDGIDRNTLHLLTSNKQYEGNPSVLHQ